MNSSQREIKFEYIYKRKADGFINKLLMNLNNAHEFFGKSYLSDNLLEEYDLIAKRQYTGLKDQSNSANLVYEHDILSDTSRRYYKVEWDYRNTGWCAIQIYTNKKSSLVDMLLNGALVVGNAYENPELLEIEKTA